MLARLCLAGGGFSQGGDTGVRDLGDPIARLTPFLTLFDQPPMAAMK